MSARSTALAAAWVLASCAIAPPTGLAAQEPPMFITEDGVLEPAGSSQQTTVGLCVLEPAPRIAISSSLIAGQYFTGFAWRIPASSCAVCPAPQSLVINAVSVGVSWYSACTAQAEVLIVGSTGPPGCLVPDPTNVLCGPASYSISGPGAATVIHSLPLPTGCCVGDGAFALVRFTGFNLCTPGPIGQSPGMRLTGAQCVTCDQYFSWMPDSPGLTEWCTAGNPAKWWMSVDADCCVATGNDTRSWGTLKTLYR